MKAINAFAIAMVCLLGSGSAFAKRDKREGVNFGLGIRMLSDDDKSLAGNETVKNSHKKTATNAVTPYIGAVVFNSFNLGLQGLYEQASGNERIVSQTDDSNIERTTDATLKALSLFIRFNFAKFMYFEGGFGVYDRKMDIKNEYTMDEGDGTFTGRREEYSVHGLGSGYHLGVGLEIAVINGFYFTSNYSVRNFTLRDRSSEALGKKRAKVERRELAFGISHYVD